VVVLKGSAEKLRVPMEAEMVTKTMMVRHDKEEMSPEMQVMAMEPMVKSMAAAQAEKEFTTGEGWRRRQHHHQARDEKPPAIRRDRASLVHLVHEGNLPVLFDRCSPA
jgi:hypothetical protein